MSPLSDRTARGALPPRDRRTIVHPVSHGFRPLGPRLIVRVRLPRTRPRDSPTCKYATSHPVGRRATQHQVRGPRTTTGRRLTARQLPIDAIPQLRATSRSAGVGIASDGLVIGDAGRVLSQRPVSVWSIGFTCSTARTSGVRRAPGGGWSRVGEVLVQRRRIPRADRIRAVRNRTGTDRAYDRTVTGRIIFTAPHAAGGREQDGDTTGSS